MAELNDIDGLGPARSDSLEDAGYESLEDLADADSEEVADAANVPEDTALSFVVQAQNYTESDDDAEDAEVDAENDDASDAPNPADLGQRDESDQETGENEDDDFVDAEADNSAERGPEAESQEAEEAVREVEDDEDFVDAEADNSAESGEESDEEEDDGGEDGADVDASATNSESSRDEDGGSDVSGQADNGESETYSLSVELEDDVHHDAYLMALLNHRKRQHRGHAPSREAIDVALDDARYNDGTVEHELTETELNELHAAVSQQVNEFKGSNMLDHMNAAQDVKEQVNEVREDKLF